MAKHGYVWVLLFLTFFSLAVSAQSILPASLKSGGTGQYFIENTGQWSSEVKYLARLSGRNAWITDHAVVYDYFEMSVNDGHENQFGKIGSRRLLPAGIPVRGHVIVMDFLNASTVSEFRPSEKEQGAFNYLLGKDERKWGVNAAAYRTVHVEGLYPGIDVKYFFENGSLRYDFIVKPGADPSQIKIAVLGTGNLNVNPEGIAIATSLGTVYHKDIAAFQGAQKIACGFVSDGGNRLGISVGAYDRTKELLIDPLEYSTYLGGNAADIIYSMTVNAAGNCFVAGYTYSSNFPTTPGAYDVTFNAPDMFVTKLNPDGTGLIYSTFIGGSDAEWATGIAVGSDGCAYIAGTSRSIDYPVTPGAYNEFYTGNHDVVVTKLNAAGDGLLYSTFIGGNQFDQSEGIALHASGIVAVTGSTGSNNYPATPGAYSVSKSAGDDIYVTVLNAVGSALVYSTFVGGSGDEDGSSIVFSADGSVSVGGSSSSFNFPTSPGAFQPAYGGGPIDGVLFKLNPDGSNLVFSSYLGGTGLDGVRSIAVDKTGDTYFLGLTNSANFPVTPLAYDDTYNGGAYDITVTKFNSSGTAVYYSTFLGGSDQDDGGMISFDNDGNAFVSGTSFSSDFPTTPDAFDRSINGSCDEVICKLNAAGNGLIYSTYLGGGGADLAPMLFFDHNRCLYLAAQTYSPNFPTTDGAYDTRYDASSDIIVVKLFQSAFLETMLPPELLTPADNSTDASIETQFTWSPVVAALRYHIQIATDVGFSNIVIDSAGITGYTFDAPILQNGTPYFWRVKAENNYTSSLFSTPYSFSTIAAVIPSLSHPLNGQLVYSLEPTLYWYISVPAPDINYDVQISTSLSFPTGGTQTYLAGTTTNYTLPSALLPGTKYYWRVRSKYLPNTITAYAAADSFTTYGLAAVPTPSYPAGVVYTLTPTLHWYMSQSAPFYTYQYRIKLSSALIWNAPVDVGAALFAELPVLLGGTSYDWQVRSSNGAVYSDWSAPVTITTIEAPQTLPPTISYPTGGVLVYSTNPTLYWWVYGSSAGLTFQLEVRTDTLFTGTPTDIDISALSYIKMGLSGGTTYYWKVRSTDGVDFSPWSSWESFQVYNPPVGGASSVPVLTYPITMATVYTNDPFLYWYSEGWEPGVTYDLQYKPGSDDFTPPLVSFTGIALTFQQINSLVAGSTYYWRVRSYNGTQYSQWSSPGSFITTGSTGSLTPIPTWPVGGALQYSTSATIYWYVNGQSINPIWYEIEYNTDGVFSGTATATNITTTFYQLDNLLEGQTYYYKLRTFNGNDFSAWSSAESFTLPAGTSPAAPIAGSPKNNVVVTAAAPVLSWLIPVPVNHQQTYELLIADNPLMSNAASFSGINARSLTATGLQHNKKYFWKVRALNTDGTPSLYSPLSVFNLAAATEVEPNAGLPHQFILEQNYPNPFNPSTTITFGLPERAQVKLTIYDQLGSVVTELIDGEFDAGYHRAVWNAAGLSSGMYYCRMQCGDFVTARKLMLIK